MNVVLHYIFPLVNGNFVPYAQRFVESYIRCPPDYDHTLIVTYNGAEPNDHQLTVFKDVPHIRNLWNNSGWDIGAHINMSKELDCDIMVCLGVSTYFNRRGWLRRIVEIWHKYGEGFYGVSGSYQNSPHIQTTAFWTDPWMLRQYPLPVESKQSRYEFEYGCCSMMSLVVGNGFPALVVTWSSVLDRDNWRNGRNISYKGDQSDCLFMFNHLEGYQNAPIQSKRLWEQKVG